MSSSEESKPSITQKRKCGDNCSLRSANDVHSKTCELFRSSTAIVAQNNSDWIEHNSRERMIANKTRDSDATDKSRTSTTEVMRSKSPTKQTEISPTSSPRKPTDVKLRLCGSEILDFHGQTGPTEIGPDKHKQTKTSSLRTQWLHGGYSLPKDSKKHLNEFNRLPFVSCGKESTCYELVTDRIQRINHEMRGEMNLKQPKSEDNAAPETTGTIILERLQEEAPEDATSVESSTSQTDSTPATSTDAAASVPVIDDPVDSSNTAPAGLPTNILANALSSAINPMMKLIRPSTSTSNGARSNKNAKKPS